MIKAKDLKFKVIKEDWNEYELEDGTIIRVKLIATKISRGIDPKTGNIFYIEDRGEPLYNVRHSEVVNVDIPKDLLKTPTEGKKE